MQMAIANYPGSLCLRLGCSGRRKALFLVIGLLDVGKGRAHSDCIWMSPWSDVLSIFFFLQMDSFFFYIQNGGLK